LICIRRSGWSLWFVGWMAHSFISSDILSCWLCKWGSHFDREFRGAPSGWNNSKRNWIWKLAICKLRFSNQVSRLRAFLRILPSRWNRISKKTFPTAFRCRPPRGGALSDRLPVKRNINWISAATHSNETRVWCMHTCIRTFFLFHFVFLLALCLLPIFLFFPFLSFPFLSFPFLFLEWFACGPLCKWSREIEGFPLSGILTAKHKAATATHWKRNTERQHWKSNEKETMSERNRSSNNRNENDIKD